MAWGTKYRGEFYDLSYSTSVQGLLWTTEIEEDGYTGPVTDMKMGGQPLVIEHMAASDNLLFDPIKGSRATINIWSETQFQYTSLYSYENFKYRVSIYYGDAKTLYWRGYLTTEYTEPYDDTPYEVSVTASDGLGLLKDMPYKYTTTEKNDTYYSGRRYESQVILDILGKLGHTGFNEYCNIYEDNLNDDNDDSPFDQVLIDMDVFRDMNCYDVLSEVLKKYNAVIRQSRGVFWIYRPIEQLGDAFARLFTAYNTKTDDEFTPLKYIHRTAQSSTLKDFNGGTLMLQPPLAQFTAEQDYGAKESWIKNYNFDTSTWNTDDPADYHYDNWTHSGIIQPLSYDLPKELQGVEIMPDASGTNYYIYQDFATYAKASSDVMIFSFDWRLIKRTATAASNVTVKVKLRAVNDDYWLNDAADDITATWETSDHSVEFVVATVAAYSLGEWATAEYQISTGLPVDGPYRITLYATDTAQVRVAFKNVRFYATNDTVSGKAHFKNTKFSIINVIKDISQYGYYKAHRYIPNTSEVIDKDEIVLRVYHTPDPQTIEAPTTGQSYILGDCEDTNLVNVIEQFAGSLAMHVTGSLTQSAIDFVNDFASDYATGGVIVTSVGADIIFTSDTAGTNFTGNTTITTASGNLTGTVVATQANQAAQVQIETMTLTGGTGVGDDGSIFIFSIWWDIDFNTSLTQTAADFVTNYANAIAGYNCTVTSSGADIIFTETSAQGGFTAPQFEWDAGSDLRASIAHTQAAATAKARIDTITLSGTSGTANILCDDKTHLVTFYGSSATVYTSSWHTRGNTEGKPLIELIADEIAALHVRERHFLQANLRETSVTGPDLNVIHGIRDTLNTYAGTARTFSINRGTFDVKSREWQIDLHEIFRGITY